MAINKIEYTVTAMGINPNTKQFGGVQGDHEKLELIFNIDGAFWNLLLAEAEKGGGLYYRFDLYNGEGNKISLEPQEFKSQKINYLVGEWVTRFGGIGKVELVITLGENTTTHLESYTFPALLKFSNRPTGSGETHYDSPTTLYYATDKMAKEAKTARDEAVRANGSAQEVGAIIKNGMRIVLEGKRTGGSLDIFATILNEIKEGGQNAVSGEAVYNALTTLAANLNDVITERIAASKLEAHPVGSLYLSEDATSPEILFGGECEWKRLKDMFIYAAGDNDADKIGVLQGNSNNEIKLSSNQLPPHQHNGIIFRDISVKFKRNATEGATGDFAVAWQKGTGVITYGDDFITGENISEADQEAVNIAPQYGAFYCWIRTK